MMVTLVPATSAGVAVPVPPLATATIPVTLAALPEMLPDTCEPGKLKELSVVIVELLEAVMLAAVPVVFWLNVGQVNVPVLKLPLVGVPKTGVTNVGDVAKAKTVPVPVVVYEVPHAEPVELAIPAPG